MKRITWRLMKAIWECVPMAEQVFFSRNTAGDIMETIFCEGGVMIDLCKDYGYIEVFGLTEDEQKLLEKRFDDIVKTYNRAIVNFDIE